MIEEAITKSYRIWMKYPENKPDQEGWYRVVVEHEGFDEGFEGCKHHIPQIIFYKKEYVLPPYRKFGQMEKQYEEEWDTTEKVVAFVPEVIESFDPPPSEFFEDDFRLERIEYALRQIKHCINDEIGNAMTKGVVNCSIGYSFPQGTSKKEMRRVLGIVEESMKGCYLSFDGGSSFILEWKIKV